MKLPTLLDYDVESTDWDGPCEIVQCKKALHPTSIGETAYSLNPYAGCEHGCIYCYAPGHTHSDLSTWRVVKVKANIVDRLYKEIDYTEGAIGLGTVTDPYQAAEGRFRLTRMCLEVLHRKGRRVFIITKSPLVLRDLDLLKRMDVSVAVTVTNPDPRLSRMTEPGAPLPEERLKAAKELHDSGIDTAFFIEPVLSTLYGREQELMELISDTGVDKIFVGPFNPRGVDMGRMDRMNVGPSIEAEIRIRQIAKEMGIRTMRWIERMPSVPATDPSDVGADHMTLMSIFP